MSNNLILILVFAALAKKKAIKAFFSKKKPTLFWLHNRNAVVGGGELSSNW